MSNYINANIKVKVPEWQIGENVQIYFKDTMCTKGICEKEWYSVNEKLPEEMEKVLVWEKYYSYKREKYVYDYNFGRRYNNIWICDGGGDNEVIAWTYLPSTYDRTKWIEN